MYLRKLRGTDSLQSWLPGRAPREVAKPQKGKTLGPSALQTSAMSQVGYGSKGVTRSEGVSGKGTMFVSGFNSHR